MQCNHILVYRGKYCRDFTTRVHGTSAARHPCALFLSWERLSANSEDHMIARSRDVYTAMVVVLLLLLLPATSLTG